MPDAKTAVTGGIGAATGLKGSSDQAEAAEAAAQAQLQAAREGIAEQRRQFDISQGIMQDMYNQGRQIMNPYVQAGYEALGAPQTAFRPLDFSDRFAAASQAPPPVDPSRIPVPGTGFTYADKGAGTREYSIPGENFTARGFVGPGIPGKQYRDSTVSPFSKPSAPVSTASTGARVKPTFSGGMVDRMMGAMGSGQSSGGFGGASSPFGAVIDATRGFRGPKPSAGQPTAPINFATGSPRTLGFYQQGAAGGMPVVSDVAGRTGGAYDVMGDFMGRGATAGEKQAALLGLGGPDAYQAELETIKADPVYQSMLEEAETGLLQNASATGGLRGGNVQSALAKLRPSLLSSFISDRYSKLGGLAGTGLGAATNIGSSGLGAGQYLTDIGRTTTGQIAQMGQSAAAGQAGAGSNLASNISTLGANMAGNVGKLLTQGGAAQAGGALYAGQARADQWNQLGSAIKDLGKIGTQQGWFGGGSTTPPVTTPATGTSPLVGDRASFLRLGY